MEAKEWNNDEMNMVKQLLDILEQQNMRRQSQDFMEAVQYVAGMQVQLASMADELHNLKEQLADMQASGKNAKDSLAETLGQLEEKAVRLSEKLSVVKNRLVETAGQAARAFKEKGRQEMNKVLVKEITGMQNILDGIREQMVDLMVGYEKISNQIGSIGDELKQVGNGMANVGRILSGKGTKEVSDRNGVALTRAADIPIKKAIAKLKQGIDRLDGLSAKLDKIREKTKPEKTTEKGEKGSLKEKLAHMQEKAGAQNRKPDLEKSDKKKEAVI